MKQPFLTALFAAGAAVACAPAAETRPPGHKTSRIAGADRDAHGCVGSAGYTWSEVRQACIRIFESGLAFAPEPPPAQGAVLQAFVVLSPAEGPTVRAAEVFVPGQTAPLALTVMHTPKGDIRPTLLVNKAEGVEVFRDKDAFILEIKGRRYRRQSEPDDRLFLIR